MKLQISRIESWKGVKRGMLLGKNIYYLSLGGRVILVRGGSGCSSYLCHISRFRQSFGHVLSYPPFIKMNFVLSLFPLPCKVRNGLDSLKEEFSSGNKISNRTKLPGTFPKITS